MHENAWEGQGQLHLILFGEKLLQMWSQTRLSDLLVLFRTWHIIYLYLTSHVKL